MRAGRTSEANSQSLPLVQTECASCCLLGTTNTHHSCVQHAAAVRQAKSGFGFVSNIFEKRSRGRFGETLRYLQRIGSKFLCTTSRVRAAAGQQQQVVQQAMAIIHSLGCRRSTSGSTSNPRQSCRHRRKIQRNIPAHCTTVQPCALEPRPSCSVTPIFFNLAVPCPRCFGATRASPPPAGRCRRCCLPLLSAA